MDAIAKALGVVHEVYGIKQAGAAQDMLQAQQKNLEQNTAEKATTFGQQQEILKKETDPTTPVSQLAQRNQSPLLDYAVKSGLMKAKEAQEQKDLIKGDGLDNPGMSAAEIRNYNETNPTMKLAASKMAAEAAMARTVVGAGPKIATYNSAAADKIHKDPVILDTLNRTNQADVDLNTLRNSPVITHQMLVELGSGLGRLVGGGKSSGLTQTEEQTYKSSQGWLAKHMQEIEGKAYNALPEGLRGSLDETYDRLSSGWKSVAAHRAESLYRTQPYEDAEKNMVEAIKTYSPTFKPGQKSKAAPVIQAPVSSSPSAFFGQDVLDYAKQHGITPDQANAIKLQRTGGK